jgi:RNA polymerase sigma-70 factor (ECF subfamily)
MEAQQLRDMIARAQASQAEGYEQLLAAYGSRLYRYFHRATGSHHDSEDLLGELMLRMVRTIKDYDDRGRFEPWLFRVASNMVRDRIRRRVSRAVLTSGPSVGEGGLAEDEIAAPPVAVDAALLATETSIQLKEALERLDATTRDMILLRHFADMSFREIAQLYRCPLGTALARVHRGLKTLRKLIGDDHDR